MLYVLQCRDTSIFSCCRTSKALHHWTLHGIRCACNDTGIFQDSLPSFTTVMDVKLSFVVDDWDAAHEVAWVPHLLGVEGGVAAPGLLACAGARPLAPLPPVASVVPPGDSMAGLRGTVNGG